LGNLLSKSKVRVETSYLDTLPQVQGNERGLQRVFIHLILNAAQAMPSGGDLQIETAVGKNNEVYVMVSDTGEGISKEILPHIFEPFFSTQSGESHRGVGLAVSQSIIHEHGGNISVTSHEGNGARFTITLEQSGASA